MFATSQPNFQTAALPTSGNSTLIKNAVLAFVGSILLVLSAKVSVGFPVPWTLQSLVVLMIGMAYGWKLGGATVLLYLAYGAIGLPVFAYGGGIAYFATASGGYLIGFLLAAIAVGFLAERGFDRNPITTAAAMVVGNALIYVPGLIVFALVLPAKFSIAAGFTNFLVGDLIKLVIAAAAMPLAWALLKKFRAS